MTFAPTVSVVVASTSELALLERCLGALLPQVRRLSAELIVSRPTGDEAEQLAARYPEASIVDSAVGTSVAGLRAAGMRTAHGDIVALVEDDREIAADWLEQLVSKYHGTAVGTGSAGHPL